MAYTLAVLGTQKVLVTLQVLARRSCTTAIGKKQQIELDSKGDNHHLL